MKVRSFAWHDIITFYRYRQKVVCTDSEMALTQGNPVGPLALLTRLNPSIGSYTGYCPANGGKSALIGHMQYSAGDRSARILFLMPEDNLDQPEVIYLLEHLAMQAGAWGAFHLLAQVEENSCALEGLRRSGFSVYAWQRIWKYSPNGEQAAGLANGMTNGQAKNGSAHWQPVASIDEINVRNLYQSLVPPLVQSAEPLTTRRLTGWVYQQEGEILAYAEGVYGPHGIYLHPLIHPAVENVSQVLLSLLARQPTLLGRPVYLSIRSYQAWLETVVRDMDVEVGTRQAMLVKHLVLQQHVAELARQSLLEKYTAEPTVPMVQNSTATNE